METTSKDKIRQFVRETYGKIARNNEDAAERIVLSSCCGETEALIKNNEIKSAECCSSETNYTPEDLSIIMGYSKSDIENAPDGANLGLGCGNPVALASLKPGETVVDLGSGGGFDSFLAARQVGDTGHVIGVDMTPDMISKARKNAEKAAFTNVEFRLGEIEHLPIADNSADLILSNCVINLSPDKMSVYKDAFRVLKPGGRLSISDIVTKATLPNDIKESLSLVSACVGGAATIQETETMLKQVGFQNIQIKPKEQSRKMIDEWVLGSNAGDFVVSAYIEAVKPE